MNEETIIRLFESRGLGKVIPPVSRVSGGFLHRMYRVDTDGQTFAVKHLNPGLMKRPGVMENYRKAEKLEQMLEDAGIPIVPALAIGGRKMQEADGEYFYLFRWQKGSITDWNNITPEQCRQAGTIQGRIHALQPREITHSKPELSAVDWAGYLAEAERQGSVIAPLLKEHMELLRYAENAMNSARQKLPDIECITDDDMDPKNVMWDGGKPVVIDLECLDYGNPVSGALQLSLQWSGITTCTLDPGKITAFFEGYLEAYDNGFRDYGSVFGLAYTWIEWLEYNITRALGQCQDAGEQETGISEVRNTVNRIRYIREQEDLIRHLLESLPGSDA
jgi:Ser/Thr protein kinase RdoA (MazF antagonist)